MNENEGLKAENLFLFFCECIGAFLKLENNFNFHRAV